MKSKALIPFLGLLLACGDAESPAGRSTLAVEAPPQGRVPHGLELPNLNPCEEVEVAVTSADGESWPVGRMTFDGRPFVYVCVQDLEGLDAESRARMHAVLDDLVPQKHFRMLPICIDGPADTGEFYVWDRRELLDRLNAASGGVVRRVKCRFGWTHY